MKRLKIVEQIIIVLVAAVLIPLVTIGFIISNVSQQSMRNELATSANLISNFVSNAIEGYVNFAQSELNEAATNIRYIPKAEEKTHYFKKIKSKKNIFENLSIVEKNRLPKKDNLLNATKLTLYSPIDKDKEYYLLAQIDINIIDKIIGKEETKGRNVYVFDSATKNLIATNAPETKAQDTIADLKIDDNTTTKIFGNKKNTPKAFSKIENLNWFVVVDTTKKITASTITKARFRIILSLSIAALTIFIIVGLYTSYLYLNIRQLFKGITAISKGNYDKKIHLIKSMFTPHEIVFLAKEFNYMASKINVSYKDLRKKNKKLQKLNEYRDNLVSATSHEFRTPLTSIIGYSSRLLRQDIEIDNETKIQSLKIIKQQAQRLSNMVEDLLVIPELESLSLKYNIQETDLSETLSRSVEYLNNDNVKFNLDIVQNLNYVWADDYRVEQILINLLDNAKKYSLNNAPIDVKAFNDGNVPIVQITNQCEKIDKEFKTKLFEKFIRVDSNLTRTTRGTGLGLYIVKGLCDAMNIKIDLNCDENFTISLRFEDYVQ